jgi:hypothetical protein
MVQSSCELRATTLNPFQSKIPILDKIMLIVTQRQQTSEGLSIVLAARIEMKVRGQFGSSLRNLNARQALP